MMARGLGMCCERRKLSEILLDLELVVQGKETSPITCSSFNSRGNRREIPHCIICVRFASQTSYLNALMAPASPYLRAVSVFCSPILSSSIPFGGHRGISLPLWHLLHCSPCC